MVKLLANHGVISWKNSKTHWVKLVITTSSEIVKELAIAALQSRTG